MQEKEIVTEDIYVMGEDPFPELTLENVWDFIESAKTSQEIVDAYVVVDNKFWWIAGEIDEREEGTEKFEEDCAIAKTWEEPWNYMKERVIDSAKAEGLMEEDEEYPHSVAALTPIVEKYGYRNSWGWWIEKRVM